MRRSFESFPRDQALKIIREKGRARESPAVASLLKRKKAMAQRSTSNIVEERDIESGSVVEGIHNCVRRQKIAKQRQD